MTRNGVPVQKIAVTNLIFAVATLLAGVVLTITNHPDQANLCFGACFGGAAGTLVTTGIVINQATKADTQNATNTGQAPPT